MQSRTPLPFHFGPLLQSTTAHGGERTRRAYQGLQACLVPILSQHLTLLQSRPLPGHRDTLLCLTNFDASRIRLMPSQL